MAGGGVGEAMAIGALMGAGTGGVMAAAQDKDPVQGALLGAVTGAATGSLGAGLGSAATPAADATQQALVNQAQQQGGQALANEAIKTGAQTAATDIATVVPSATGDIVNGVPTAANALGSTGSQAGQQGVGQWMASGQGTGFAPGMTNAQAYGAGAAGGIGGLYSASQMPGQQDWPTESEDTSSLSYFKYDPTKYRAEAPTPRVYEAGYRGMADGGIASLNPMSPMSNPVYPQSQQTQTAFSTSPQYPNSMRSAIASDYDTRTNPTLGTEMPMGYADGGGIGFLERMHPGGKLGEIAGDLYGTVHENSPSWLNDAQPGGFMGASQPGRLEYEARQRQKQEEEDRKVREARDAAAAQAAQVARDTGMNANMARGGIASLGGYSDGGRLLRGPGDGVSDSIPASIGGRQPARLADGEFVVPSRIVSELGNGSTDAGARRLYDMMDRVQRRRGTTVGKGKIAKNTKAYQELPA